MMESPLRRPLEEVIQVREGARERTPRPSIRGPPKKGEVPRHTRSPESHLRIGAHSFFQNLSTDAHSISVFHPFHRTIPRRE